MGIPRLEAIARINLAWIHVVQAEWDQAASLATQSVEQQTDHAIAEFLPEAYRVLAHVAVGRNRLGQARQHAERCLELARQQHNPFEEAGAQRILGEILRLTRDFGAAVGHLQHSLDLFGQIGDRFERARTQRQLAWLRRDQGDERAALEHAIPALTTFIEMHARREAERMQEGNRLCLRLPCPPDEAAKLCQSSMQVAGWQEVERTAAGSGGEMRLSFDREEHRLTAELEADMETTVVSLRAP